MPAEPEPKTTHDLAFAAYLILRGYKLVRPPFIDKNALGVDGYAFALDAPFERLDGLFKEFGTSDAKKYDTIARDLRKMVRNIGTDKGKTGN